MNTNKIVYINTDINRSIIPNSEDFWDFYHYYPQTTSSTWRQVGGTLLLAHLRDLLKLRQKRNYYDSCALRVSIALHYVQPIPAGTPGANRNMDATMNRGESLADEDGYMFTKRIKANIRGRFILSSTLMTNYLTKIWGVGESISSDVELLKFENSLGDKEIGVFATTGHTGVIKKGYQDPYIKGYLPVNAWRLK